MVRIWKGQISEILPQQCSFRERGVIAGLPTRGWNGFSQNLDKFNRFQWWCYNIIALFVLSFLFLCLFSLFTSSMRRVPKPSFFSRPGVEIFFSSRARSVRIFWKITRWSACLDQNIELDQHLFDFLPEAAFPRSPLMAKSLSFWCPEIWDVQKSSKTRVEREFQ